jgi:hypothetical protein
MDAVIIFILFILLWRGLGLHHNHSSRHESEREKKRRLEYLEKQELERVKKYYLHPAEDWIDKIRTEMFNEHTFTVISINDKLYVVGHTMMMPCKDIWEAKKLQYRNIIEYSNRGL